MKKASKLLALLLALAMMTMLTGCGSLKKTVQGDWLSESIDITGTFMQDVGDDEEAKELLTYCDFGKLEVAMLATFNEDDTVVVTVEPGSFHDAMDGVKSALVNGLGGYFEALLTEAFSEAGLTLEEALEIMDYEDLDSYIIDCLGGTIAEYVETEYSEEYLNEMAESFTKTGTYTVEKGSLLVTLDGEQESVIYNKSDDSLTFCETDGDITFSRVKG